MMQRSESFAEDPEDEDAIIDERQPVLVKQAPRFTVPSAALDVIEHPCIVKNIDRGLQSLGGSYRIGSFLRNKDPQKAVGVTLRPNDPLARPTESRGMPSKDLLLKVTIPKRTGRKRKRGSDEPFQYLENGIPRQRAGETITDPQSLLEVMRDRPTEYSIQFLGKVKTTHRFRNIPDMQVTTSTDPVHNRLRDTVLRKRYPDIINFELDITRDLRPGEVLGAPGKFTSAAHYDIPFNYWYKQNPNVTFHEDEEGQRVSRNIKVKANHYNHIVGIDAETVPFEMPYVEGITPEDELKDEDLLESIGRLRAELHARPIMTKRVINSKFGTHEHHHRHAWAYVGYVFRSGPWKDCLVRFGVDPRKDPKYRFYQSEMWKLDMPDTRYNNGKLVRPGPTDTWKTKKGPQKIPSKDSYLFDGKKLHTDGKVWQFCDIEDPTIKEIVHTEDIRPEFDRILGWYHNGTIAKIKVIMKFKIRGLMAGSPLDDSLFDRVKKLPEQIISGQRSDMWLTQHTAVADGPPPSKMELEIATDIRSWAVSTYIKPESSFQSRSRGPKRQPARNRLSRDSDNDDETDETDDDEVDNTAPLGDGGELSDEGEGDVD